MTSAINFDDLMQSEEIRDAFDKNAVPEPAEYDKFGQLHIQALNFKRWETTPEGNRIGIDISLEGWQHLPKREKSFEYKFTIDVEEFDKRAKESGWDFSRRIQFEGTDWFKIFTPSVELIFGEKSLLDTECSKTLAKMNKQYIWARDVPQSPNKVTGVVATSKTTGKPFMTIKLIEVFSNREECQAAHNERFSSIALPIASTSKTIPTLPGIWAVMPLEALQSEYQRRINVGETIQEIAVMLNIIDAQGNPSLDKDNNQIDSDAVLAWLADTPF